MEIESEKFLPALMKCTPLISQMIIEYGNATVIAVLEAQVEILKQSRDRQAADDAKRNQVS